MVPSRRRRRRQEINMVDDFNVLVIGIGGQGILTVAEILARAGMLQGFKVLMAEIHGMAQRGGRVPCSVRFGDSIHSAQIPEGAANLVISLEFAEALTALPFSSERTAFVINKQILTPPMITIGQGSYPKTEDVISSIKKVSNKVFEIDALGIARRAGLQSTVNIVMLGAGVAAGNVPVEKHSVIEAMKAVLSERSLQANTRAYELGYSEITKGN
jgi:indolepyruvate ferredoxin oxidoreductase beta subunit